MAIDLETATDSLDHTTPGEASHRVRTLAVACTVAYWGLLTAMMLAIPDAMHSAVLWALLALVTGAAMLVFAMAPFADRGSRSTS